MTGGIGVPELFILALALPGFVFWVWMLVSAANDEKLAKNEKTLWILAILFTNVIGAVAYFVVRSAAVRREARP